MRSYQASKFSTVKVKIYLNFLFIIQTETRLNWLYSDNLKNQKRLFNNAMKKFKKMCADKSAFNVLTISKFFIKKMYSFLLGFSNFNF
jgi:hypothetical protein